MRLICPNCGAQYEVGPDAVPLTGRDVQCSNCGHTWFEAHGASQNAEAELETDANVTDQHPVLDEPEVDESAPSLADEIEDAADDAKLTEPPRQEIDASVSEILKEEASRETAARQKDASLETQSDLGIEEAITPVRPTPTNEAGSRIAKLRGEQAENASNVAALAASSRKEMLPDIEEINSTLRTSQERGETIAPAPEEVVKTNRRGFRTGFVSMLLLIALLVLVYVLAAPISNLVPALKGPLDSYVSVVDGFRAWLNSKMSGAVANMESSSSSDN